MTGATSGIGLEAANCLLRQANCSLIVAARTPDAAPPLLRQQAELHAVDLADISSVRGFAARLVEQAPIGALVLNAGVQCASRRISIDGYELTFAVNHLAHYLLLRLLVPRLSAEARIVLTSSGTHDPLQRTKLPAPRHANAQRLAYPHTDPDADKGALTAARRAYTSSKLCNVMTVRALAGKLSETRPDLSICAFDPGLTFGTGLARNYPWPVGAIFKHLLPHMPHQNARASTPAASGRLLAELVISADYRMVRGGYFAVHDGKLNRILPSRLAQDDEACEALWIESGHLLNLPA
jgi:NAD(P)-dependent dehydrogenase (short-subunit alcohol dehydrogenase family)